MVFIRDFLTLNFLGLENLFRAALYFLFSDLYTKHKILSSSDDFVKVIFSSASFVKRVFGMCHTPFSLFTQLTDDERNAYTIFFKSLVRHFLTIVFDIPSFSLNPQDLVQRRLTINTVLLKMFQIQQFKNKFFYFSCTVLLKMFKTQQFHLHIFYVRIFLYLFLKLST